MPITKEVTLYTFEELSDDAKERARDWWRGCEIADCDNEFQFDDFVRVGDILGVTFKKRAIPLVGGGTRYDPTIYYSGFSSQGDGACFEGSYAYVKGCAKAIRDYAPKDETLHRIADDLAEAQRKSFYRIRATMEHRGHYYHSGCMRVEHHGDNPAARHEDEESVTQAMRDFADWIYKQLEADYDYRMSDEAVDESILANEYTFTKDGRRED